MGQVVVSRMGRDEGKRYLVVGVIDERFVNLADGSSRKLANPKRKNIAHLILTRNYSAEIERKLASGMPVSDEDLRAALDAAMEQAENDRGVR